MTLEESKYRQSQASLQRTIATGATSTLANMAEKKLSVIFNPTGTLPAHTATFPDTPLDGQEVEFTMLGSGLTGGVTITNFQVAAAGTGITVTQAAQPGQSAQYNTYSYKFVKTLNTWIRRKPA